MPFKDGSHRIRCACGGAHGTALEVAACNAGRGRAQYNNTRTQMQQPPALTLDDQLQKMLRATKDGRYATRMGAGDPYKFFRISRPKNGRFQGAVKIQRQHSEWYESVAALWANGKATVYTQDQGVIIGLRLLVCDPTTATIDYGREMERCGRCGVELTDARSRHYGIGPECEKHWPEVIAMVATTKGAFNSAIHS